MGWKNLIAYHYQIKNIGRFTIMVSKNQKYDDIITKISPNEYLIDTYYRDSNILAESHVESNIKNYISC